MTLKRFLSCLIKFVFNISAEKSQERRFYLSGNRLFHWNVKPFQKITSEAGGISILEPFDSQIVSIISSILRASEGETLCTQLVPSDPFQSLLSRSDLLKDLKRRKWPYLYFGKEGHFNIEGTGSSLDRGSCRKFDPLYRLYNWTVAVYIKRI